MPCRAAKQRALRDRMIKNGPRSENQQIATPFFSSLLELKQALRKGTSDGLPIGDIMTNLRDYAEKIRADVGDLGKKKR